jgi:hypothetical protein
VFVQGRVYGYAPVDAMQRQSVNSRSRLDLATTGLLLSIFTAVVGVVLVFTGAILGIFVCALGLAGALQGRLALRRALRQFAEDRSKSD